MSGWKSEAARHFFKLRKLLSKKLKLGCVLFNKFFLHSQLINSAITCEYILFTVLFFLSRSLCFWEMAPYIEKINQYSLVLKTFQTVCAIWILQRFSWDLLGMPRIVLNTCGMSLSKSKKIGPPYSSTHKILNKRKIKELFYRTRTGVIL